jgi:hypothetical protein
MKSLFLWIICIFKKRHKYEFFKKRQSKFHQFYGHGGGKIAHCEYCKRVVFISMKNKKEIKNEQKK